MLRLFTMGVFNVNYFKAVVLAATLSMSAGMADAGNLANPEAEPEVQVPFEPAQGSVNGGLLLLGAFALFAALTAAG